MTAMRHVRTHLIRGLLLALPMIITLWLLRILFGLISDNVTPWAYELLRLAGAADLDPWHGRLFVPLIGVLLTLAFIYLLGLLAANLVGRRLLAVLERGILKIPLVRSIYGGSRQLLDALDVGTSGAFSRVVLVEYPRRGVWTVGFVTNEVVTRLAGADGEVEAVTVFFPTTPNPTSGWLALVPVGDIRDVELSIEEGVKLIVSGGIVAPGPLGERVRTARVPGLPAGGSPR